MREKIFQVKYYIQLILNKLQKNKKRLSLSS